MGDLVDERYRGTFSVGHAGRIGLRLADEHPGLPVLLPSRIVFGQRYLVHLIYERLSVMHPIMVLEVNPRSGQEVEEWHFLHLLSPCQEDAA